MLDWYEEMVDELVDSVKRNPGGNCMMAAAGVKLYGAAMLTAAPIAGPALLVGAGLYGLCKWRKNKS